MNAGALLFNLPNGSTLRHPPHFMGPLIDSVSHAKHRPLVELAKDSSSFSTGPSLIAGNCCCRSSCGSHLSSRGGRRSGEGNGNRLRGGCTIPGSTNSCFTGTISRPCWTAGGQLVRLALALEASGNCGRIAAGNPCGVPEDFTAVAGGRVFKRGGARSCGRSSSECVSSLTRVGRSSSCAGGLSRE